MNAVTDLPVYRDPETETAPSPLASYLHAMRVHWRVVVGVVLTVVTACAAWLAVKKEPEYEATAKLLVSPVPEHDASFVGLPLVRAVGRDSTRAVETAAEIVHSPAATSAAAEELSTSFEEVEKAIDVKPAEDTNIIDITATASSPERATEIANSYIKAAVRVRESELRDLVAAQIALLRAQLAEIPDKGSPAADLVRLRLAAVESIEDGDDPTLSAVRRAPIPKAAIGPPPLLVVAIAAFGGLAIGIVLAVLLEILTPRRIEDERDLQDAWRLPVLVRIPLVRGQSRWTTDFETVHEHFRSLRAQLEVNGVRPRFTGDGVVTGGTAGMIVVVTSPTRGDGRTTTAVGLARAVAISGYSVLVLDLDRARPAIERLVDTKARTSMSSLTVDGMELRLSPIVNGEGARAVVADDSTWRRWLRSGESLEPVLAALRREADWVIVDTAPPPAQATTLDVMRAADRQLVVARRGHTLMSDLIELRELSERSISAVPGYVLFGGRNAGSDRVVHRYAGRSITAPGE